jgi:hypothetical protein
MPSIDSNHKPNPPSAFTPSKLNFASSSQQGFGHGRSSSVSSGLNAGGGGEMFKRASAGQGMKSGHDVVSYSSKRVHQVD